MCERSDGRTRFSPGKIEGGDDLLKKDEQVKSAHIDEFSICKSTPTFAVRLARADEAAEIAPLFDAYRQFYGQDADLACSALYLRARLCADESTILLAEEKSSLLGFCQLYPSFSSVRARPTLILNDLFVAPAARSRGVGQALINAAEQFAISSGIMQLSLETGTNNKLAQCVYERMGWIADMTGITFRRDLEQFG